MKIMNFEIDERKLGFVIIFSVIGLLFYHIKFSTILGVESKNFTLFQFIGPIAAGILGPVFGALSVLAVEGANFFISGGTPDLVTLARFLPMVFAAIYFSGRLRAASFVAPACMVLFWLHPIGQAAWFYPLYWLIPLGASYFKNNIFARSLGTTFTAHAIGSTVFLYAFAIPADVWAMLVPIVAIERLTFAGGITLSYYAVNTALDALSSRIDLSFLNIEKKYALAKA